MTGLVPPLQTPVQLLEPQFAVVLGHAFCSAPHSSRQGPSLQLSLAAPQASFTLQPRRQS